MLSERKQILIVDDEPNLRRVLSAQLGRDGYEVHTAEDGEQASEMLLEHHIDLVITDLRMPKVDGMQLLRRALEIDNSLPVILLTAHGTVDNAVEALKTGAFDYITKPFDQEEVRSIVRKALRTRDLSAQEASVSLPSAPSDAWYGIIGQSEAISELHAILRRAADSPSAVLVTGEGGTGKELVARALHEHSARAPHPFIKLNCAAIPKELMESELFGHERGAFNGAVASKPGRFELAHGGTLFLDEIGAIPLEIQIKVLRALQENEFERVGGIKTIRVAVRVVAATNNDLKKELALGNFREDLYYGLNVVPIRLPPLRERVTDIPLLIQHFVAKFNARLKKQVQSISPELEAELVSYSWPGNIRELENTIERAVLFCDGTTLQLSDLPPEMRASAPRIEQEATPDAAAGDGLKEQVKAATSRLERELIVQALKQTHSNVTHAARLLKISRKGLQLKMKELGLREREDRVES